MSIQKKSKSRKVGLILSGIGAVAYLIQGLILLVFSVVYEFYSIPYTITGVVALLAVAIVSSKIKINGGIILLSIPILIIIMYIIHPSTAIFAIVFLPFPFPHVYLIIIGGILSLDTSGEESYELEKEDIGTSV